MEVFVKVIAENLLAGERRIAPLASLHLWQKDGKPSSVPQVLPETEEEHWLHTTGSERAENRKRTFKK